MRRSSVRSRDPALVTAISPRGQIVLKNGGHISPVQLSHTSMNIKFLYFIFFTLLVSCTHSAVVSDSTFVSSTSSTAFSTTTLISTTSSTTTTTTLPWNKKLVAVGDIACSFNSSNPCRHHDVAQLITSLSPDAFLALGDIQYENGSYNSFLDIYDKSFGHLKNITYPVPGNHEYYSNLSGYNQYFDEGYLYYSYDIGPWHLVGLDSENITTDQLDWLTQDLANTSSDCVIAYWHRPRFSSGPHGNYKPVQSFWQLLPDKSIVLSGHDHHYERFNSIDGITQFVVGTGGKNIRSLSNLDSRSAYTYDDNFGVLLIDLYQNSYNWYFVSIDGFIVDTGTGSC